MAGIVVIAEDGTESEMGIAAYCSLVNGLNGIGALIDGEKWWAWV